MAAEIEQIFGFPDRETDEGGGEGGHYGTGDTVTADTHNQTQIGASGYHHSVLSWACHRCSITKAQIAPSPPFQLFVITCRFFVSINQLDG